MVSITAASMFSDALVNIIIRDTNFNEDCFASYHPAGQLGRNLLLKVKNVMIQLKELATFDKTSTLRDLMLELTASPLGVALFLDSSGKLKGILTDGDLRRIVSEAECEILDKVAFPLINTSPTTVDVNTTVGDALVLMENRNRPLNVLPVLGNRSRLEGLIRLHDIIR